jgi:polar amino acid transport system permease protein
MPALDFTIVPPYAELLLAGLWWTLVLAVSSSVLSFAFGIFFALVVLYAPKILAYPIRFFMWLFMGTPLLLQLYLIYYGLVQVGGIIALSLHFAVYNADVFRAGIVTVDPGQTEGARSIGLSRGQTLRYIIIPQAIRNTIPPIGNNMIVLLKDTSLVSIIGIAELVHSAQIAISETYSPFEFYLTAAVLYYAANLVMEAGLRRIERKVEVTR